MKLIIRYIKRHLLAFLTGIFCLVIEAAADLLQPAFMAYIVDYGVKQADVRKIIYYGLIMLSIAFLGALGVVMRNYFSSYVSRIVGKEMRSDLYRKVQTLSFENIDRLQTGTIITRITNDVTQIQDFVNSSMRMMFKTPILCMGAVVLIMIQTPRQIPLMFGVILGSCGFIAANMKFGYPRFAKVQQKLDRLNIVSREFLSSIRVVKAFRAEERQREKFHESAQELAGAGIAADRMKAIFSPLTNLTVNLGIVIMVWTSGLWKVDGIGKLMASINYMSQIVMSMTMVFKILNTAVRAAASANRIQEILDEVPAQKKNTDEAESVRKRQETCPIVEFRHVSFQYAGAGKESLNDISFSVNPGETIGIIGPTGSGKSTLMSLISRFYDATDGMILVDGEPVNQIDERCLRNRIAMVPQKALLFTGTVEENLRWGKRDASLEEMKQVTEIACVRTFIEETKEGYQTRLGQGGVNLSGGQKQRLTIARALLKKPEILILDDCTSALDAATEANVLAGLREQTKVNAAGEGKEDELRPMTVFLISQRIATVMRSDRILCIENGTVQGFGTHQELMQTCKTYQDFYKSQIGE